MGLVNLGTFFSHFKGFFVDCLVFILSIFILYSELIKLIGDLGTLQALSVEVPTSTMPVFS